MSLDERYKSEKAKWDDIAQERAQSLGTFESGEDFHRYARKKDELIGISEFLGDLTGKRVLEIGCGVGLIAVLLAKSGAKVTAFDLSPQSVQVAKKRSEINHTEMGFIVSAGEYLPFADESFDVIFGKSILHHLDIEIGKHDLYRVLQKGGKAVFVEPMGMNPILTFVRKYIPYPHKAPVGVDRPLTYKDMESWTNGIQYRKFQEIQLLSMIERGFGYNTEIMFLRKLDQFLLKYIPFLRRFCRYVIIFSIK
jgi:ubiquinone/menaquinone biosynthesis C-methylase UbiE